MLTAADVREHAVDVIPAATHVDGSARIQTVSENQNPILHHLLTKFHARTGCPVLINTSFNVRGEPIVCNATDTLDCFFRTDLDAVVIGNLLARKLDQQHRVVAHTTKRNEKNRSGSILSRISDLFHQITFPIRWFVSVAVLTIIYFIFITPVGVIWRLLNRRARISSRTFATIDRDCESYWRERPESPDKSRYFKQY